MKAMVITAFGDSNSFQEVSLPKPQVIPGHVLIKVIATGVNPLDSKLRRGVYPQLIPSFPMILHGDVAGVIEELGEGVEHFAVGDEVYGCVGGLLGMPGALAEYVVADANLIALKPSRISFREAAALPLICETAWEALVTKAKLRPQQTALIHGGTGGVGHIAVQLAKWLGAKVYATCSADSMATAKQLGADVAIDYRNESVQNYVKKYTQDKGFDVIFDTVGGENLTRCFQAVALFGHVMTIHAPGVIDLTPAYLKSVSLDCVLQPLPLTSGINRPHYGALLKQIATLVDENKLKVMIDEKDWAIADVAKAHAYLDEGKVQGKLVLRGY